MQIKNIWKTGAWGTLASLIIAATTAQAQFTYTTNSGTLKITGYTGPGGDVTIPDTITELSVASIGDYAFNGMSSVSNITFPGTLIDIGHGAFQFCANLTNVTIPDNVKSIGSSAFGYCYGLTNAVVGNGVTNIDDGAFYHCSVLSNVSIGNSVARIGSYAFYLCGMTTSFCRTA